MSGLWRKELRSLLPFALLLLFFNVLGIAWELVDTAPQLRPLSDTFNEYVEVDGDQGPFLLLLALALSAGLLVREFDEGTIEFLDTLPVSRIRIFAVKVAAAMGIYAAYSMVDIGLAVALHAFARNSLDPGFHTPWLAQALVLRLCQFFVMLSFGLLFSFLRRFGWLLAGLIVWTFVLLDAYWPLVQILNPFHLTEAPKDQTDWPWPTKSLALQLSAAFVALSVAGYLFSGAGGPWLRGFQRLLRNRWGYLLLLLASVFLVLVGGSLFFLAGDKLADEDEPDFGEMAEFPAWTTSRASTRYYQFLFPTNLTDQVKQLTGQADEGYSRVAQFFRADPPTGPIVVDLTSALFVQHAGLAYWQKVQLNPSTLAGDDAAATLGHETAHVLIERLSDSRMGEHFDTTRFFHEGVATFVEHEAFSPAVRREELRLEAAVLRAWDLVDFEQLIDNPKLCARLDANVVYPLGEVFTAALIRQLGDEAVGKICRAWGRRDAQRDLKGIEKWYDTFQFCEYDLDAVIDRFYGQLDEEVEQRRAEIDSLEPPRGTAEVVDGRVQVTFAGEEHEGWEVVCRFRAAEDSRESLFTIGERVEKVFRGPPVATLPSPRVWYQLGLRNKKGTVIYQRWTPFDVTSR